MRVLRGCNMMSLVTYSGKWVLLGFLLLVGYVAPVWTIDYTSLDANASSVLKVGDRLVSSPNPYFELGIFNYSSTSYFLSIRYAPSIDQAVTWMASRSIPLSSNAVLQFDPKGSLDLSDSPNPIERNKIWYTVTDNRGVASAQLLDTGKLVLMNKNGTELWNSFDDDLPTDTLLPGQGMNRSQGYSLNSWQRTGDPLIPDDTYSLGWDSMGVLTLSWTCSYCKLDWKGGPYIPAPDVYAAHTIPNVDRVYFHKDLGHLYIDSRLYISPTAILSGGPDLVSSTTLKRITMFPDGGLRILQYKVNKTLNQLQTSNRGWEAVANWVVSDRPDSRSQCTAFGTCGQFSVCVSPIDSLGPVTCRCPGQDNTTTKGWFKPIDDTDPAKGCTPQPGPTECIKESVNTSTGVYMLELVGVDMPWGGDYRILTGNNSVNCKQECMKDCFCAGAVYSKDEQMCWMKNGLLYNLGYPTVALHGTDRTSYLRNQTVPDFPNSREANDSQLLKILVPAVGILGVLLIALVIFRLSRNDNVRQRVRACCSCCRRPTYEIKFPPDALHETPVKNGPGDRAQI